MNSTILIAGHGPGIAHAVARRSGQAGYRVALVARNEQRLTNAVDALVADGITAQAFPADLSDIASVRHAVSTVHNTLGSIGVLHWNAFTAIQGDLLATSPADLSKSFDTRVSGYVAAVQAALEDLQQHQGTVLVTSGVMGLDDPAIDAFSTQRGALATSVAAQHKATGILAHTLASRGIHVGEVVVNGFVEGTPGDDGKAPTVAPKDIAERFWQLHTQRHTTSLVYGDAVRIPQNGRYA